MTEQMNRKGKHKVELVGHSQPYWCTEGDTLLHAMEQAARRDIPIGCRGGGCGICKIKILHGNFITKKMSQSEVNKAELAQGIVLACRCTPLSDIELEVIGKLKRIVTKN